MQVTLVGMGPGTPEGASVDAWDAIEDAEVLVGAGRLMALLPDSADQRRFGAVDPREIAELLERERAERACILFSGDTGFYSGARLLLPLLREKHMDCWVLPGLSSVQLLAARLGRPWQDWTLRSVHGRDCDAVAAVLTGRPAFFLTGGENTPSRVCKTLADAGLGFLRVTVGEALACPEERVTETTAVEAAGQNYSPLSVLLVEPPELPELPAGGLADECFVRGKVPMTKQLVRAAIRSLLALRRGDTVWDVGAGTGGVSVELALCAREGRVFAVERDSEALSLIETNRARLGAWNLTVVPGEAPEACAGLPRPDAVFIGGSGGKLREIVNAVLAKNPEARLCLSAIAMETVSAALALCEELNLDAELVQLSVSRTRAAGGLHLLTAHNPVFLISAVRRKET